MRKAISEARSSPGDFARTPRAWSAGIGAGFVLACGAALAADLPEIKATAENHVPACVTPGRLQAYLEQRNPHLDQHFSTIAVDYMRLGEALDVRWDFAFYQMMRETGALSYEREARFKANTDQNNFAGLKPVGSDSIESFPDVATGVRAHLEHLLFYAGVPVAEPVSKRTRKQQDSRVLADWQNDLGHPVTFEDMAKKWTDGSHTYATILEKIADGFDSNFCNKHDPHPEYVAMARGTKHTADAQADVQADAQAEKVSGTDLARRALAEPNAERSALGAGTGVAVPARIPNAPAADGAATASHPPAATAVAAAGAAAKALGAGPNASRAATTPPAEPSQPAQPSKSAAGAASAAGKCRVWTASYGGRHAVIVKSVVDQIANFTVLDVNEGQETREADAFIEAYAKGGSVAGTYPSQDRALEKAFELCPDG